MSENQTLEGGSYEVIRGRLDKSGALLQERLDALNTERQEVFGSIQTTLVGTERVMTEHNCVPRDLVSIGNNLFLFGYNIHFGLKATTQIEDVFALYRYDVSDHSFHDVALTEVFDDASFIDDFKYLYRYYKQTVFIKFMQIGPCFYLGMQTGKTIDDIKAFKFLIKGDGTLQYEGNRFDHEYQFPDQQEFTWKRAHRDMQRAGEHPHVSIEDRVFVETIGGDLTVKIEDNTEDGEGIYSEPVTDTDQSLDDAEFFYACVGHLILLKVLPYREELYRYLVYNEKTHQIHRVDEIGHSCVLLPDDQGLIFSNGYLLLTGEAKFFETDLSGMFFDRRILSANGEDSLFVFYNRESGDFVLLAYNKITQTVETPVICNGYSLFSNGELIYFKTEEEPQRHHTLQIWQTPLISEETSLVTSEQSESFLYKIGNPDLVRGMAECREVLSLLRKDDSYGGLYLDLTRVTSNLLDSYFWITKGEAQNLAEPLRSIQQAASSAIEEFEKVQTLRRNTKERTAEMQRQVQELLREITYSAPDDIMGFVRHLAELRTQRGHVIALKDLRYADLDAIDALESEMTEAYGATAQKTVGFLLLPEALLPYSDAIDEQSGGISQLGKVTDADEVTDALDQSGKELELLIEVVSNLKIEDATHVTTIIDQVSALYARLNSVRAELKNVRQNLAKSEGTAQFSAQMKLISQSVVNFLDISDTPEKCAEYLTKLMIQLEELEGRFSEFDEYLEELAKRREEIYEAFEGRKQALLEKLNKRATTLQKSADRILNGVSHRLGSFSEITEINGYFAGDLMVEKLRETIDDLRKLGDSVKADELQTRLKTTRDDAIRALKDRQELFVDGQAILKFGRHQFSVNEQELELSIVSKDEKMCFHLSGTAFFEPIRSPEFLATKDVWNQEVVSESREVYRAEYLAYQFLLSDHVYVNDEALLLQIQSFMQARYSEGYTKGIHDYDAAQILHALLPIDQNAGLLKYSSSLRVNALRAWDALDGKEEIEARLKARLLLVKKFPELAGDHPENLFGTLSERLPALTRLEIEYLLVEFSESEGFTVSQPASDVYQRFQSILTAKRLGKVFEEAMMPFEPNHPARFHVAFDWLSSLLAGSSKDQRYFTEAAYWVTKGGFDSSWVKSGELSTEVSDLRGTHPRIKDGVLSLNYNEFLSRCTEFTESVVPNYERYIDLKQQLVDEKKEAMRLDEFKPRVMSAFVRNRLINEVYLPLIGDNLAKQIGTAGSTTRTDRMGLLLLVSPPGYGKTTLMEYIANRLGLTFMKINGPAIGHEVRSLDPSEAPNASAREEVEKLNLALEMGDNIMIYLDDIQHTNPELLQKFISLCDGQRKIEGVYNGKAKTYDLRGKKVAVVMSGNPYTETGGKFQIPDMLANRADTYNLGEIIGENSSAFESSFIENSLTSNAVLSKLSNQSQRDLYSFMTIAETASSDGVEFEGNYSPAEIEEYTQTLQHIGRVRDTIMKVNAEYVRSAAQEDAYRTEPSFRLQGSYRNMNRMAEKVLPLMTSDEVDALIIDHYQNESQTLTTGAEANLLKFHEMNESLSPDDTARWDEIKKEFKRQKFLGGGENDPITRVVAQLTQFNDGLEAIHTSLDSAGKEYAKPQTLAKKTLTQLETIIAGLRTVPVDVEIKVVPVESDGATPRKLKKGEKSPIDIDTGVQQNKKG